MQVNQSYDPTTEDASVKQLNYRAGSRIPSVQLLGEEGRLDNYRFTFNRWSDDKGGGWPAPRHHHPFEQVRYAVEGDYTISKGNVMPAGWVAYFPESVFYGPQVKETNLRMVELQFGGPTGLGYYSTRQRRAAHDELVAKGGTFEGGFYQWTDEDGKIHRQDSSEAVWEVAMNVPKLVYPRPRYNGVILMDPESFSWQKETPGVAHKLLGVFTERELRISLVELEKGASLTLGTEPSNEIVFLTEGSLSYEDELYVPHAAFATSTEDEPESLVAAEAAQMLYVKLPTFSRT